MKNNPISFLQRYWALLTVFVVTFLISWTDFAFGVAGSLVYLPVYGSGATIAALVIRHIFFKNTLDQDAHNGFFVDEWKKLGPRERIYANLVVMSVLFIGMCMIAAALIH